MKCSLRRVGRVSHNGSLPLPCLGDLQEKAEKGASSMLRLLKFTISSAQCTGKADK